MSDTHAHDYHPPGLQHQFEDMKQQEESNIIGDVDVLWAQGNNVFSADYFT
ncbi:MAG: hypothetical protein HC846_03070, partial [Blastocatellia bacterium]|nr:hypothetical protein [Blastocatellia bacterium]